jgi:predicted metalloprotease with PDZ domain
MRVSRSIAGAAGLFVLTVAGALAQGPAPITLAVDASDAPRRIFHVTESIPAPAGPLTLVYPKFIPGEHSAAGPITDLVGLKLSKGGRPVAWKRVPTEMWSFTCDVPEGPGTLDAAFDYVPPLHAWTTASAELAIVNWWSVLVYPEGVNDNATRFAPSLRLPAGWTYGTALPVAREAGGTVSFQPVSLVMLIDSPVLAGAHLKTVDLTPGEKPGHWLHIASDSAAAIEISPEDVARYRRLVAEALALFGARHYENYHFLLTLSDHIPSNGLEHHEASDNRGAERSLTDDAAKKMLGTLLSHEYVHSWNGKYRRPEGLVSGVSANYQSPVDSNLLWVYEGLTEYYGDVLGARSGLRTPELYRENLALTAAAMDNQAGRAWRPLEDTAVAAQLLYDGRADWADWRRGVDFYPESELIWLEADTIIRQKTGNRKSLDDFARAFHGPPGGVPAVKTYRFEDVVSTLNTVAPYDWAAFFQARVRDVAPRAPLGGIEGAGWRLVYNATPNEFQQAWDSVSKQVDQTMSIGLQVSPAGGVQDVVIESAAWRGGFAPGMTILSVGGVPFTPAAFEEQLNRAKAAEGPIEFAVRHGEDAKTLRVDYHGGALYPHIERDPSRPDVLASILAARGGK